MTALPYRPHPLLRNGHLQTMMIGMVCGERPPYRARQQIIPLRDGEALVAHEELSAPVPDNADLVIMLHGLGGDHTSPYLQRLARNANLAGFKVWRIDLRGCGAGASLAWRPANAGRSEDLEDIIQSAVELHPVSRIRIVGFSLSGNILLKMLGTKSSPSSNELTDSQLRLERITAAIAVAPPCDLAACAANMDRLSRRVYTKFYLRMLDKQVDERRRSWPRWHKIPRNPQPRTIREFDARYTAPLSGFRGPEDYYAASSSLPLLPNIDTPTTVLLDRNDPIVDYRTFENAQFSTSTSIEWTEKGGHMGYFARDEHGRLFRWLEYRVLELLKGREC
ncbi:MAG: YheT family hydrolase [Aureliella sp.]